MNGEEFGVQVVVNEGEGLSHEEVYVIDATIQPDLSLPERISFEDGLHEQWQGLDGFREDELSMWAGGGTLYI